MFYEKVHCFSAVRQSWIDPCWIKVRPVHKCVSVYLISPGPSRLYFQAVGQHCLKLNWFITLSCTQQASIYILIKFVSINWAIMYTEPPWPHCCSHSDLSQTKQTSDLRWTEPHPDEQDFCLYFFLPLYTVCIKQGRHILVVLPCMELRVTETECHGSCSLPKKLTNCQGKQMVSAPSLKNTALINLYVSLLIPWHLQIA